VPEIALRARIGAIGADPRLGDVEITSMIRRFDQKVSISR
jgi:hypothetical protein